MSSIFVGNGLGLFDSTLTQLNGFGSDGKSKVGQGNDLVSVNAATGNLVVQSQDEFLASVGLSDPLVLTYNSQGAIDGDNNDGWRLSVYRSLNLPGKLLPHANITRTSGDGHVATFKYDGTSKWTSTEGAGADDFITQSGAQWVYTEGSTRVTETYDTKGTLLSTSDANGNTTSYTYNTNGQVTSLQDSYGQIAYLNYTLGTTLLSDIRIHSLVQGTTNQFQDITRVRYTYDGGTTNRLQTVTVDLSPADGSTADSNVFRTSYVYDGQSDRIVAIAESDGSGNTTASLAITYKKIGAAELVETISDRQIDTTQFSYKTLANQTTVTDPQGNSTVYNYNSSNELTEVDRPAVNGTTANTQYSYDNNGNVTQVSDASGRIVNYTYGSDDNLATSKDAYNDEVDYGYDTSTDLLISQSTYVSSNSPQSTHYAYDANRNLRFTVTPEGRVTEYRYATNGERISSITYPDKIFPTTPAGFSTAALETWLSGNYAFSGLGPNIALSRRTDNTYDTTGQLQTVTTYAAVDSGGNGVLDGNQSIRHYVYDASGRLLVSADPRTASTTPGQSQVTSYVYDGLDRQIQLQDGSGRVLTSTFTSDSASDTIIKTTNAAGLVTTTVVNSVGETISVTLSGANVPSQETTLYAYNRNGQLLRSTDPTGQSTYYVYDARGDRTGVITPQLELTETQYNAAGQTIAQIRYASPVTATLSDFSGLPLSLTIDQVRPGANSLDRLTREYYDQVGRLEYIVDADGFVTQTLYDSAYQRTSQTQYYTALTTIPTSGNASDINVTPIGGYDRTTHYFYDQDGNLTGELDAADYLTKNIYDAAGQVVQTIAYSNEGTQAPLDAVHDRSTYYFYNARGQQIGRLDAEAVVSSTTRYYLTGTQYDVAGNVTSQIKYGTAVANPSQPLPTLISQASQPNASLPGTDQVTTNIYDNLNRLVVQTDYQGTVTQYNYDPVTGFLIFTTRALGQTDANHPNEQRTTANLYDGLGRVTATLGGIGSAAYLAAGSNVTAQNAAINSYATQYVYDLAGRRIQSTDADGHKTFYYYDGDSRLVYSVVDAGQSTYGNSTSGEVTGYVYDAFGDVTSTTQYATRINTNGLTGGIVNNALTSLIITSTKDRTTRSSYLDNRGLLTGISDGIGANTGLSYNAFAEISSREIDESTPSTYRTRTDEYSYDLLGRTTRTVEDAFHLNLITSVQYDAFGRVTQTTDPNGVPRTTQYDALGRTIVTGDGFGNNTLTSYDAFSRVLSTTDRTGQVTTYGYNDAARTLTVTTPEGVITTTTTNRSGQTFTVARNNGTETTRYGYDLDGNLISTQDPINQTSTQTYDNADLLQVSTDGRGIQTRYTYDSANRVLTRTVDPTVTAGDSHLNLTTSYQYNAFGNAIKVTDPNGVATETQYNNDGAVVTVIVDTVDRTGQPPALKIATVYSLDAQNRQTTVYEGIQATGSSGSLNADPASAQRVTTYSFDNEGRRIAQTVDPSGLSLTTSYAYDKNGNLVRTTDPNTHITRYTYDANNRQVYSVDALGDVTETRYDQEGRTVQAIGYATALTAANLASLSDASTTGSVTPLITPDSNNDRVTRSVYDRDGRLAYTIDGVGAVTGYAYDGANRVTDTVKYATPVQANLLPDIATPEQVKILQAALYTQDFSTGIASFTLTSGSNVQYDAVNKKLLLISGPGPSQYDFELGTGQTSYAISGGGTGFRAEINTGTSSANRFFSFGASGLSTSGQGERTQAEFLGGNVYIDYFFDGVQGAALLGSVKDNTTYVVESEVSPTGSTIFVYERGKDRSTGYSYNLAGEHWATASSSFYIARSNTYTGSNTATVDNIIEYAVGTNRTPSVPASAFDETTHTTYDLAGRTTQIRDAEGKLQNYTYDGNNNKLTYTNQNGALYTYVYDAANQLTLTVSPSVATYSISSSGAVTLTQNSASQQSAVLITYDRTGNVLSKSDGYAVLSNGAFTTSGFTSGRTTTYLYDALGRQLSTINQSVQQYLAAADKSTGYGSTSSNFQNVLISPQSDTYYDNLGNAVAGRTPGEASTGGSGGAYSYKLYDTLGRLTYEVDGERFATAYAYTADGSQSSITRYATAISEADQSTGGTSSLVQLETALHAISRSSGSTTAALASALAKVRALIGILSSTSSRTITTAYDAIHRKTSVTLPSVDFYVPTRNSDGSVGTTYSETSSPTTTYNYNSFSEIIGLNQERIGGANPVFSSTFSNYDRDGRVIAQIDARGYYSENHYDSFGRLDRTTEYANPLSSIPISPPQFSSLTKPTASGAVIPTQTTTAPIAGYDRVTTYQYDRLDRQTEKTRVGALYSSVDGNGNPTSIIGSITSTTSYDGVGNVIAVTDEHPDGQAGNTTNTFYNALGQVVAVQGIARTAFINSTLTANVRPVTQYGYDNLGNQIVEANYSTANVAISTNGTLATSQDAVNDQFSYTRYDILGRSVQAIDAQGDVNSTAYDAQGHVVRTWHDQTDLVTHQAQTQVSTFSYDRTGRQIASTEVSRTPTRFFDFDAATTAITYNGFGEAVGKSVSEYVSVSGNIFSQVDGSDTSDYDAAGRLWQSTEGGVDTVYRYDLLGNATAKILVGGSSSTGFNTAPTVAHVSAPSAIPSITGGIETDTVRDALGNVIQSRDPSFTEDQVSPADGGIVSFGVVDAITNPNSPKTWTSTVSSYSLFGQPVYSLSNSITLHWASLASLGATPIKVLVNYTLTNGTTAQYSATLAANVATTGTTLNWGSSNVYGVSPGTIQTINSVFVSTQNGNSSLIRSTDVTGPTNELVIPPGLFFPTSIVFNAVGSNTSTAQNLPAPTAPGRYIVTFQPATLLANTTYQYYLTTQETPSGFGLKDGQTYYGTFSTNGSGQVTSFGVPGQTTVQGIHNQTVDRWNNVIQSVDARNSQWITSAYYDDQNHVVQVVSPVVTQFNSINANYTAAAPITVQYYDVRGLQIATQDADTGQDPTGKHTTTVFYDAAGEKIQTRGLSSNTSYYDALGRQVVSQDGNAVATNYTYDRLNRLTKQELLFSNFSLDQIQSYTYDESGNRTSSSDVLQDITRYEYDTVGEVVRSLSPISQYATTGNDGLYETTNSYNIFGKKIATSTNLTTNISESWGYDYYGHLLQHTDLAGSVYGYRYDGFGRLIQQASTIPNKNYDGSDISDWQQQSYNGQAASNNGNWIVSSSYGAPAPAFYGTVARATNDLLYRDFHLNQSSTFAVNFDTAISVGATNSQAEYFFLSSGIAGPSIYVKSDGTIQYKDGNGGVQQLTGFPNATSVHFRIIGSKVSGSNGFTVSIVITRNDNGAQVAAFNNVTAYAAGGQVGLSVDNQAGQTDNHSAWADNVTVSGGTNGYQDLVYQYYSNGALKNVTDFQNDAGVKQTSYRYDVNGNRVYERTTDQATGIDYENTYISYDALGRVDRIRDPQYQLSYGYDAVGNRIRIFTQYADIPGSTAQNVQDFWYQYDGANRITLAEGKNVNGVIQLSSTGARLSYDQGGNRRTATTLLANGSAIQTAYTYTPDSKLATVTIAGNIASQRSYDRAGREIEEDDYGITTTSTTSTQVTRRLLTYNANGQVLTQNSSTRPTSGGNYTATSEVSYTSTPTETATAAQSDIGYYDYLGNALRYDVHVDSGNSTINYLTAYTALGDSEQKSTERVISQGLITGVTNWVYDPQGNNTQINNPSSTSVTKQDLVVDAQGHILFQSQVNAGKTQTQSYFYANDTPIGSVGSIDPSTFDYNYTPVSASYPQANPGTYVVSGGETLQTIAVSFYGDGSLWYLIADANGLSTNSPLTPGQTLTIPNQVTNLKNNVDTFKPYSISSIVGDSTPTLTAPPPPKQKSQIFSAIVGIVVAIVATILTVNPAVGAAAGEIARQDTQLIIDGNFNFAKFFEYGFDPRLQQQEASDGRFDFKNVAIAGAAGYIGGAVGGYVGGLTSSALGGVGSAAAGGVAGAVAASASTQEINLLLDRQQSFSFSSLAAAAVSGGLGGAISGGLYGSGESQFGGTPGAAQFSISRLAEETALRFSAGIASQSVQIALDRTGKLDFANIAADAFGNALGNSIVAQIKYSRDEQQRSDQLAQSYYPNGLFGRVPQLGDRITLPIGEAVPAQEASQSDYFNPDVTRVSEEDYYNSFDRGSPYNANPDGSPATPLNPVTAASGRVGGGTAPAVVQLNQVNVEGRRPILGTAVSDSGASGNYFSGVPSGFDSNGNPIAGVTGQLQTLNVVQRRPGFFSALAADIGYGDFGAAAALVINKVDSLLTGSSVSDLVYVPGPISAARYNLGGASVFVNSALNTINALPNIIANAGLATIRAAEPELSFLADHQGEFVTAEVNGLSEFPLLEVVAVAGTSLVGGTSQFLRALGKTDVSFGKSYSPELNLSGSYATNNAAEIGSRTISSPFGCFVEGTLIHTQRGLKAIQDLRIGDLVLSQPERTGEQAYRRINDTFIFDEKAIFEVSYCSDDGSTESVRCTPNHPFWINDVGWTGAEHLKPQQVLMLSNGRSASVTLVSDIGLTGRVYNFEVDGFHTYYVGKLGVWVHNADCFEVVPGRSFGPSGQPLPYGFDNIEAYSNFVSTARAGLPDNTSIIFNGSSVTGRASAFSNTPYSPFDVGRVSDFDLAVVNDDLYLNALDVAPNYVKTGPDRIGPLQPEHLDALGLSDLQFLLTQQAGRPVNFTLFDNLNGALKGASLSAYISGTP